MIDSINKREYLSNIAFYLAELKILTNRTVIKSDLSPIKEVNEVRLRASSISNFSTEKFEMGFAEKNSTRFNSYIHNLYEANNEQVYIWTSKTNVCGLYKADNIKEINFSFPFELNDEGVIVFLSADLKDKLLMDFSIDSTDKKVLEIESQGLNWSNIKY